MSIKLLEDCQHYARYTEFLSKTANLCSFIALGGIYLEIMVQTRKLLFIRSTVEPVYIEHSREMKKCSMYAGAQCIQVQHNWRSGEIETKSRVIRKI